MDYQIQRTSQSIGNILQVTKNIIKENQNFYDYYINKDNSLYEKQIPLLIRKSKMQALAIYRKEIQKNNDISKSLEKDKLLFDNIRNAQIKSKKLPPLCPFYNEKGEMVPSVVKTCKVYNRYNFENIHTSSTARNNRRKILKKILPRKLFEDLDNKDDFENIENDYFNFNLTKNEKNTPRYDENKIFRKKDYYIELINKKMEEFKNIDINGLIEEYKKEKIFEKNRKKKKIILTLDSITVQIFDNINNKNDSNNTSPIFEFNLPFIFLPLFYYKGEEKFKIILSKIIEWDNVNKKFNLIENKEKIIKDILLNCSDFNPNKKTEEKINQKLKSDEQLKQGRARFNQSMTNKKILKKETFIAKSGPIKEDQNFAQTMAGQIPNTYLTNIEGDEDNKYNITYTKNIYPIEKEYNFMNYNIFEFLWLVPDKAFNVSIKMPLISVQIPKNNIIVQKYLDFELLFFLYENGFNYWDFYLIKYLTSFKTFRALLEDINSVNEAWNKNFYLTVPRIKSYSFNNYKFVNIVSIRPKDILDNLIEGLNSIPEDKKGSENLSEKHKNKKKEPNEPKSDIVESNQENNNNIINTEIKEEATQISKEDVKLQSSTFIQRSFIVIVRFVDNKTLMAREFKIYFNFSQFQKFQKLEKFIDKISFLTKFIDINHIHKLVSINYKSLDNFNEDEWIKDFQKYNNLHINNINTTSQNKTFAEFSGLTKNINIQIEVYKPISLIRTLNDNGSIKTEKIILGNNYMDKTVNVEKDNIEQMSRIFYESYENEGGKNVNK